MTQTRTHTPDSVTYPGFDLLTRYSDVTGEQEDGKRVVRLVEFQLDEGNFFSTH